MKILVVGASGYIGKNFARYSEKRFTVHTTDSREGWKTHDFSGYTSVVFAAGIAHRRQSKKNAHLYFAVNRDLAVAVAEKAKRAGVPHFVYISSMAIFGKKEGEISAHTKPNPRNNDYYATSKREAEIALTALQDTSFAVALIRPPMVYGDNCPGKFAQLAKIARYLPLVPCNKNKRSVIYIDALSQFLCTLIASGSGGVFHPHENVRTSELIVGIRQQKKTRVFGAKPLLRLCGAIFPPIRTAFGTLYYSKDIDEGEREQ